MTTHVAFGAHAYDVCLVRGFDPMPRGHGRLETVFKYPDGASIDLFLVFNPQLTLGLEQEPPRPTLSDLGQTTSWLADMMVKPWLSKKRQRFVEGVLSRLGVEQRGGALVTSFEPTSDGLEDAIVRLGQACIRLADLIFTRRISLQEPIIDEVEELIGDAELTYEPNVGFAVRGGNVVTVDFLVSGRSQQSTVLTLVERNRATAHPQANEVFAKFYDLANAGRPEQRLTIFDDRHPVYRDADFLRLEDVSVVMALSERREIVQLLAA